MKDETRGFLVIAVTVIAFCTIVYVRRATKRSTGQAISEALGKEASEILQADAVALVPDRDEGIEVWPKGSSHSLSFPSRMALAGWLCSTDAPKETAVVMLKNLPVGRGKIDSASNEGKLAVEVLRYPPIRLECASQARFYSLELR